MGFDQTRTNPVYTPPQQPKDYGKPQTGPSYSAPGLGSNTGGFTGKMYTMYPQPQKAGGGSGQAGGQQAPASPYGSASGPGILENWFNQRAAGTDPAFEYGMKRGNEALDNNFAAAGSFNSGAAAQGKSDLYANLVSQRMGQLDALAGGASAEHQGRLNAMFGQGLGLAQGQSGLASAYDLGAAGNMEAANQAQQQMQLNKAGVDQQAAQSHLNSLIQGYAAYQSGKK